MKGNPEHIEIQSFDLFNRIEQIHRQPAASTANLRAKYILLRKVLEQACYELTSNVTAVFANLFSRLDFICKEKKMNPSDRYAIQTMRRNCNSASDDSFRPDMNEYLYDLRAIVRFISLAFEEDIPASILPEIPHSNRPYSGTRLSHIPYVRASVSSWDEKLIYAATDNSEDPFIVINYAKGGYNNDLVYISGLLQENMQINILDIKVDEENHYIPKLIVLYPDYLIDISSLSACFREYGHHAYNYFINRIKPKANSYQILLGNLAGQLLDDYVNERSDSPVTYANTLKKFFSGAALDFCTCNIPADFHSQAQAQMMNIRSFVNDILPHSIASFNRNNVMLEASFICEKLGLQGRVDLLQKDFNVLIEQKAGKKDEYNHRHKEDHFLQMMLYHGILMYNFGKETENMQTFLLYSKYTDGLMIEHFSEKLFRECIKLRNLIVCNEMALGQGGVNKLIEEINTDLLNEFNTSSKLWTNYQEPELYGIIQNLKHNSPLEKAYFERFYTFTVKESILAKTGGNSDASRGFAGLWHIPLAEKIENGNILVGLKIKDKKKSSPGKGYDIIELNIPEQGEDFLPNFRKGDIIIFYSYHNNLPDVRKEILQKGNILEISHDSLTVILRNGQQNKDIIGNNDDVFAIEHDYSDASANSSIRGLYSFLSARYDRKQLLLGVRPPEINSGLCLNGDYGRFNEIILKEKQANDFFLLVGPPGTGKTSCALRYMVEEALSEDNTSLLLLSYTNRAVDEICSMLIDSGIAERNRFIRIGNEMSCDKRYTEFLLKNSISDCPRLQDIKGKILSTRIFVGTTTAINSRLNIFDIKHFNMAIIDEASQILEPDIIGILSARNNSGNAIDKFVLIGDYKQLPAIAIQGAEDAVVTDPLLKSIGIFDCRNSLFERLYRISDDTVKSVLRKQGRMHPAIAEFPNNAFYYNEKLESVPLEHQKEELPYGSDLPAKTNDSNPDDADLNICQLLKNRRMIFIPCDTPEQSSSYSEKANVNEAKIVACLLKNIYSLTKEYFDADKTVGVIVPYRNQIAMIRKEISLLNIPELLNISIDTVERYQGSQRDVIIYSFTVRNFSQLNFLTSNTFSEDEFIIDRKLNVAITRARKQLILTGNPQILGANITFFKLMEYIRINNGYIETSCKDFCKGNFTIPQFYNRWDIESTTYSLPEHFNKMFEAVIGNNPVLLRILETNSDTRNRELISYGRTDFSIVNPAENTYISGVPVSGRNNDIHSDIHKSKETKYTDSRYNDEVTAEEYVLLYNFYNMRKQYSIARALYENCGNWLRESIKNVSGRIVFCDLSYESSASGLAFIDICSNFRHIDMNYIGIHPIYELSQLSRRFFEYEQYRKVKAVFYPRISSVKDSFWSVHSVLPELVIFNLSNIFDRISPLEARHLAIHINQTAHAHPLNHYVLIYRDDAGKRMNINSYRAFSCSLSKIFLKINESMPVYARFYYNQQTDKGRIKNPESGEFIYEILSNR